MGDRSSLAAGYVDIGEERGMNQTRTEPAEVKPDRRMKKSKGGIGNNGAKAARVFDTEWRLNNTARWVESAAKWLAEQDEPPAHVVSVLKEKFGLRALEACRACALANQFRGSGRASL